jgi:hypothetical protein
MMPLVIYSSTCLERITVWLQVFKCTFPHFLSDLVDDNILSINERELEALKVLNAENSSNYKKLVQPMKQTHGMRLSTSLTFLYLRG